MGKFRKKPVVVEAMQWHGMPNPIGENAAEKVAELEAFDSWIAANQGASKCRYRGSHIVIPTLEGDMEAAPGDWIIRGVKGELYPCKPDIFAATYEAVDG